jgi:putative alpha-1,2-mannosidase
LDEWFRNDLQGEPGDEDGGGMSAFVVFSEIGIYPVTPGTGTYNIGSPSFENTIIHLDNGKEFKIIAKNCSRQNKYIQSAKLNGKEWNKPWFYHKDIQDGGVLELIMGDKANKKWGSDPNDAPLSSEPLNY